MKRAKNDRQIQSAYARAKDVYLALGVDPDRAVKTLAHVSVSLHCWQGDDVGGFESAHGELGGGLAATGHYPGKARTADELRRDLDEAFSLIPGHHRLNLHALYAEPGRRVDRNRLEPEHFRNWLDWARAARRGLDFNPTFFSHPNAASGFTLSHADAGIRRFWIEHGIACRKIGEHFGRELGTPSVVNIWIPDGFKDTPFDRSGPRHRLKESLDAIFSEPADPHHVRDAVEPKLFGLGSESYVVGSHEFYLGYAVAHRKLLTLDSGHFHPTETIADKLSAVLCYLDEILLHVSRGVRWDSDHVVILSDDLLAIAQEIVRGGYLPRVHIGLDYFDASINRVAAWVIGARNMLRALLLALLEPAPALERAESSGDYTSRLALMEEAKALPFGAVWDYYCLTRDAPVGGAWLRDVKTYEQRVLSKRK